MAARKLITCPKFAQINEAHLLHARLRYFKLLEEKNITAGTNKLKLLKYLFALIR